MTRGIGSCGWRTAPQRHLGGRVPRFTQAKVLGGGSTIIAQIYMRGNARRSSAAVAYVNPALRRLKLTLRTLDGLCMACEILRQPALRPFMPAERMPGDEVTSDADLIAYAHRSCKTGRRPVGTCRMGKGPDAVVIPDLRVHGLDGLHFVDASIIPRIPSCNTNAPAIMNGEKAADLVRGLSYPSNQAANAPAAA